MATKTKIVLPKVASHADDTQMLADRVDKVLSQLTSDLTNFQSPDSAAIGGTSATVISQEFTIRDLFFQTFETDISAYWNYTTGLATATTQPTNGKAGGKALSASSEVRLAFPSNIPYDDTRRYRMRVRYRRRDTGTLSLRVGVDGYASDGLTVVDRNGSTTLTAQNNVCLDASAATPTVDAWQEAVGYFQGESASGDATTPSTSPDAPRVLCDQTAYFRPFVHFNVGGGTTEIEVDFIAIEVLPDRSEIDALLEQVDSITKASVSTTINNGGGVANNQVGSGAIQTGAVTTAKIAAGAVTANEIAANTITASEIAANTITASQIAANTITASQIFANTITSAQLASLTGGGLTINFAATGSNPVLSHSNFSLNADGSATFSGTVSATSFTGTNAEFDNGYVKISGGDFGGITSSGGYTQRYRDALEFYFTVAPQVWEGYIQAGPVHHGAERLEIGFAETAPSPLPSQPEYGIYVVGDIIAKHGLSMWDTAPATSQRTDPGDPSPVSVSGTGDDSTINTNFSTMQASINGIRNALKDIGAIT